MKTYKDFEKEYIGSSDIASLVLVGYIKPDGVTAQTLKFGGDDSYDAYMVTDADAVIGEHYTLEASFDSWLRIYDDDSLTRKVYGDKIEVYRAGEYGCIIRVINAN